MFAYVAFFSMNSRRGPTSSPISMEKIWSASAAFSMVHLFQHTVFRIHGGFPQLFGRSFLPNLCIVVCVLRFRYRRHICR